MRDLSQRKADTHVEKKSAVSDKVSSNMVKDLVYLVFDWRISEMAQTL